MESTSALGRTSLLAASLLLVATGCVTSSSESSAGPGPVVEAPVPNSSPATPVLADSYTCGPEFPLLPAPEPSGGFVPWTEEGRPGAGPGSGAPADGQLTMWWPGEFEIVYELRWPATPPEGAEFTEQFAPVPSFETGMGTERMALYLLVGDDPSDPCAVMSLGAAAPRPDPIPDQIFDFASRLVAPDEWNVLAAEADTYTRPVVGADRPNGACAEPVRAELDEFGEVSFGTATAVWDRFMADRFADLNAKDCLTVSGLESFEAASEYGPACLFACGDGFTPTAVQGSVIDYGSSSSGRLVSAIVEYTDGAGGSRVIREVYTVRAVDLGSTPAAFIVGVAAEPDSWVDETTAHDVLRSFLAALRAEDFETAAGLLPSEGSLEELGGWIGEPGFLAGFADYCADAMCGAESEILGQVGVFPMGRDYLVRFVDGAATAEVVMSVGSFEGQTYVATLPPRR